jgi:hypothetical protein
MIDATDLNSAIAFIKQHNPDVVRVSIKGFVRIKRDLVALHRCRRLSYSETPKDERWLWHQRKAMEKASQQIMVMGVPVVRSAE